MKYAVKMARIGRRYDVTLDVEIDEQPNIVVLADRLAHAIWTAIRKRRLLMSKFFEVEVGVNDSDDGHTPGEIGEVRVERYGNGTITRL